jgi:hypothetical protein
MIIDEWIYTKTLSSTGITQYTTQVYPDFVPEGKSGAAITYTSIGFNRNRLEKNMVFSLTCFHRTKSLVESMNDQLYSLYDTSTSYIRESSSNLYIDSVTIINNSVTSYDKGTQYWSRVLDISVWYH